MGKLRILFLALLSSVASAHEGKRISVSRDATPVRYGIRFLCENEKITQIYKEMGEWLSELNIPIAKLNMEMTIDGREIQFGLDTPERDTTTLDLLDRVDLKIPRTENVEVGGKTVEAPSRQEILLSLMQHGRLMELSDELCDVSKLKDHVGIRQRIAAWAMTPKDWRFGVGTPTTNEKFWEKDEWCLRAGVHSADALADVFVGSQNSYRMACQKQCMLIMCQGIFDYVKNVKKDKNMLDLLDAIAEKRPVYGIRTRVGSSGQEIGKYLDRAMPVAPFNWVPGDWGWLKGDPTSSKGYEGSNTIYVGGNRLIEAGSGRVVGGLESKLKAVFHYTPNRTFDPADLPKLLKDPVDGGILSDHRDFPKLR